MAHLLASIAFSLIAVGALALIAATLIEAREDVLAALGMARSPAYEAPRRAVRVRVAGRWQAPVPAREQQPARAVA